MDLDFIPDSEFKPDNEATKKTPDFIPDDKFKPDEQSETQASAYPNFIPDDKFISDEEKHSSPLEQLKTVAENVGQGALGPLATGFETKILGVKPEDIKARQEANPNLTMASQMAGNIGLIAALPEVEFAKFGQVGAKAINSMIQMGVISGNDEISKAMLGQGDPTDAVAAHVAGSAAMGLMGGALFGKAQKLGSKGLELLENQKVGTKLSSFLKGLGHAATFPEEQSVSLGKSAFIPNEVKNLDQQSFKIGQKAYHAVSSHLVGKAVKYGTDYAGYKVGGVPGAITGHILGQYLEKAINKNLPQVSQKYVGPAILKAAASGKVNNIAQILDHATTIGKGASKISNSIENLFNAGTNKAIDYEASEKERERLREFIEEGGVDAQIRNEATEQGLPQFAKGGSVRPAPENEISHVFPEQNVLLNAAKARVSTYLNSQRPIPNPMKLPYDKEIKDRQKERQYNQTLDLANNPLSIIKHMKHGTLLPKHVQDFKSMYPELHEHLSKKITEKIMKGQLKDEKKPPYKTRQAMSMFLGSNLDSTLNQPNIMAAQNVFVMQKQQMAVPQKSTQALNKMGKNSMTPEQARTQRLNKS